MGAVAKHLERFARRGLVLRGEGAEALLREIEFRGHPVKNEALRLIRQGFQGVVKNNRPLVLHVKKEVPDLVKELRADKTLPEWQVAEAVASVNAEFVEFFYFDIYHPYLMGGDIRMDSVEINLEQIGVSEQSVLFGLADLVGELGKSLLDRRAMEKLTLEEEIFLIDRFVAIAQDIVSFLVPSEVIPDKVLSLTGHEKEFRFTFRGRLVAAKKTILYHKRELFHLRMWQRLEARFST